MSQGSLAQLAEVELSTISRIERGLVDPSFMRVRAIALALQLPLSELFDDLAELNPISNVEQLRAELEGIRRELQAVSTRADEALSLVRHINIASVPSQGS